MTVSDAAAEAVLNGRVPQDGPALRAAQRAVAQIRALPVPAQPAASGVLAQILADGLPYAQPAGPVRPGWQSAGKAAAASGLSALVLAGTGGAAAADVLPAPVQDRVAAAVEAFSSVDVPDSADRSAAQAPAPAAPAVPAVVQAKAVRPQPAVPSRRTARPVDDADVAAPQRGRVLVVPAAPQAERHAAQTDPAPAAGSPAAAEQPRRAAPPETGPPPSRPSAQDAPRTGPEQVVARPLRHDGPPAPAEAPSGARAGNSHGKEAVAVRARPGQAKNKTKDKTGPATSGTDR